MCFFNLVFFNLVFISCYLTISTLVATFSNSKKCFHTNTFILYEVPGSVTFEYFITSYNALLISFIYCISMWISLLVKEQARRMKLVDVPKHPWIMHHLAAAAARQAMATSSSSTPGMSFNTPSSYQNSSSTTTPSAK